MFKTFNQRTQPNCPYPKPYWSYILLRSYRYADTCWLPNYFLNKLCHHYSQSPKIACQCYRIHLTDEKINLGSGLQTAWVSLMPVSILGNEVLLMQRNSKQQHMGDTCVCLLNSNQLNLPPDAKGKKKKIKTGRTRLNQVWIKKQCS